MAPKCGIIAVHTDTLTDVWENTDEIVAYNMEMNDLIDYMSNVLTQKFNAEMIDVIISFNELAEKINSWCDNVGTIFIIGYTYISDKYGIDINETIKNIIAQQTNNTSKNIKKLQSMQSKLESKFKRGVSGIRNDTLIFNLFGFYKEEAVKCFNVMITEIEQKLIKEKKKRAAISSNNASSSNNNDNNTDWIELKKIKAYEYMLNPIPDEEKDMNKENRQSSLSPNKSAEKIDDDSKTKWCEDSDCEYYFGEKLDDVQIAKFREGTSSIDSSIKKDTSDVATDTESSSPDYKTTLYAKSEGLSPPKNLMTKLTITSEDSSDKESSEDSNDKESSEDMTEEPTCERYFPITVKKALTKIRHIAQYAQHDRSHDFIKIDDAYGKILAESIYSNCDVPAFRVSTKHGYAVLTSDGDGRRIILDETSSDPVSLISGTCIYVKSGQHVPGEATAVVGMKDVKRIKSDPENNLIWIKIKPEWGQNIKNVGSEIRQEERIIRPFVRIGPTELGLLAATGRKEVLVVRPASIGILSIGNSLAEPGQPLTPGYVYDSNRISIIALLKDNDFNSIVDFGIVTDDEQSIKTEIGDVLKQVDILVTIGCTSDYDLLKPILKNDFHATIHFGNVLMKPGKSTMFASCKLEKKEKHLVCLPKNPVSALISAHLFLLPILNGLHGVFEEPCTIPARIQERYILHPRPRVAWAVLEWNKKDTFATAINRENLIRDKLSSCQTANALLLFPPKTVNQKVTYASYVTACPIK